MLNKEEGATDTHFSSAYLGRQAWPPHQGRDDAPAPHSGRGVRLSRKLGCFISAASRASQGTSAEGRIRDCAEISTWLRHTYPRRRMAVLH